jgi:hypothetical protein
VTAVPYAQISLHCAITASGPSDSYGINFTEAFVRARRAWAAGADYSVPPEVGA